MEAITRHAETQMAKLTKSHYRIGEVENITGVPRSTLHDWIKSGDLKTDGRFGIKPKSPYKFAASEVQRVLNIVGS